MNDLRKIRIAAISEAHMSRDIGLTRNGYEIYTSSTRKTTQGAYNEMGLTKEGWGVLIRREMRQHIPQVDKIDRRFVKTDLKPNTATIPLTVVETYAPRKGGYKDETRYQQRNWSTKPRKVYQKRTYAYGAKMQTGNLGTRGAKHMHSLKSLAWAIRIRKQKRKWEIDTSHLYTA